MPQNQSSSSLLVNLLHRQKTANTDNASQRPHGHRLGAQTRGRARGGSARGDCAGASRAGSLLGPRRDRDGELQVFAAGIGRDDRGGGRGSAERYRVFARALGRGVGQVAVLPDADDGLVAERGGRDDAVDDVRGGAFREGDGLESLLAATTSPNVAGAGRMRGGTYRCIGTTLRVTLGETERDGGGPLRALQGVDGLVLARAHNGSGVVELFRDRVHEEGDGVGVGAVAARRAVPRNQTGVRVVLGACVQNSPGQVAEVGQTGRERNTVLKSHYCGGNKSLG